MSFRCEHCSKTEPTIKVVAVCHHCGKPLCKDDAIGLHDPAFATEVGEAAPIAVHCRPCRERYHSRIKPGEEISLSYSR